MAVCLRRLPIVVVALLVSILLVNSSMMNGATMKLTNPRLTISEVVRSHQILLKLRAGEAVLLGKRKKQKPTFFYMIKAFFSSMVDPTYSGQVEVLTDKQKKAAKLKGKRNRLGAGPFGVAGPTGGASFGPVCGPNGCR